MKREFTYLSADQKTQIHAIAWEPAKAPCAVVQLCHGMVEFIDRYDAFARYLNQHGFYVVGNDHLGHGASVLSDAQHGFFAHPDGNACVISDIHTLRQRTERELPKLPYFMLGHSMGSFLLRQYIQDYGEGLSGAIIMGTGSQPAPLLVGGKLLCRLHALLFGEHSVSRLVNTLSFASFNKAFEPARTTSDWLTRDEAIVDFYRSHPWCSFSFTVNAYYHMFCGIQKAQNALRLRQIPVTLPLLLVSGEQDPVGHGGKDVRQVYQTYLELGLCDVRLRLFPEDRHEILNELDRDKVYAELLAWLQEHLG